MNFSWNRTACGLLAVYREAVQEYRDRPVLSTGACG
jgi:hypothetical protein